MRKIVAGLFLSVDGVIEAPETWTGPYFSPEIGQLVGSLIAAGDTLLLVVRRQHERPDGGPDERHSKGCGVHHARTRRLGKLDADP